MGQVGRQRGQPRLVLRIRELTERAAWLRKEDAAGKLVWVESCLGNGTLKSLFFPLSSLPFGA